MASEGMGGGGGGCTQSRAASLPCSLRPPLRPRHGPRPGRRTQDTGCGTQSAQALQAASLQAPRSRAATSRRPRHLLSKVRSSPQDAWGSDPPAASPGLRRCVGDSGNPPRGSPPAPGRPGPGARPGGGRPRPAAGAPAGLLPLPPSRSRRACCGDTGSSHPTDVEGTVQRYVVRALHRVLAANARFLSITGYLTPLPPPAGHR